MLKNNDQRREFILNKNNWIVKDSLSTLGIRALELKLTNSISLIKFEKKLTQEEKNCTHNQYHYVDDVKVGDYVKFDMGNDFLNWLMDALQNHLYQSITQ